MDQTDHLSLPYLLPNQAQKHVTVNEALRLLDALVQLRLESRQLGAPPAAPLPGARYLVASDPIGDWTHQSGNIAAWQDGAWSFIAPADGWLAWIVDEAALVVHSAGNWIETGGDAAATQATLGINAAADTLNRLTLKSEASLFDHDGADHRLKLNKAGETDTVSLLFQSDYTGHAEVGLIGDNRLAVKTSTDGAVFETVMIFDPATQRLGIGTDTALSRLHVAQPLDARLTIETTLANSGGGFDILNSTDNQRWRVTGERSLFKLRDHTGHLDKLILYSGASGDVLIRNCGNVGIGTASPTVRLDVDGAIRVGQFTPASLPSAAGSGLGALACVSAVTGGPAMAFSDGSVWRWVRDNTPVI